MYVCMANTEKPLFFLMVGSVGGDSHDDDVCMM